MFNKYTNCYALAFICGLSSVGISSALANERTCYGKVSPPSIAGYYSDNFGSYQLVGNSIWVSGVQQNELLFYYCTVSNTDKYIVAQNDATHNWNPNEYSRFEWTTKGKGLWYCQQVFSAKTEQEAADTKVHPKADASKPESKGCGKDGKSAWTKITSKLK